jgi:hypothetical protein
MSFRNLFDARKYGPCEKLSRRFSQQIQAGRAASEYTPELAKITAPHCRLSKRIEAMVVSWFDLTLHSRRLCGEFWPSLLRVAGFSQLAVLAKALGLKHAEARFGLSIPP